MSVPKPHRSVQTLDAQLVPMLGVDSHLAPVSKTMLTPDALRQRFNSPRIWTPENSVEQRFSDKPLVAAAVLIPLVMRAELMLLLTQRAHSLTTHSGQIAFPGGRADSTDADAADTALREASEEIDLARSHVEVLGTLPAYTTGTGFRVTPVVALVQPDVQLTPSPGEVADIFEVPLHFLMNPAHHRRHEAVFDGVHRQWLSMPYVAEGVDTSAQERFIWGATAGMLRNLYRFLSA